jgi:FixJ family two-component response regulator
MSSAADLPQVLVIDDEIGPRESLRMLLKPNYEVHTANSVEAGIRLLREKRPDAIISDIRMPGTNGIDGLRRIREIDPHVAVIMLTGFGALETAQEALRLGANDYISKPFDAREMRDVISRNVERTRLHRTAESASSEIKELNNRLLKELAQKEHLASLGQASAEFVHDLGNPLTIVWGYVQLLAKKLEQSEKEQPAQSAASAKELNIIEQNVRLCRELLTMWQSYGSVEAAPHKPISGSAVVREVVKGVESIAVQSGVTLTGEISEDPCMLLGDPVQLKRAIQNVIVNAVQAAAEKKGSVDGELRAEGILRGRARGRHRRRHHARAACEDFRALFYDPAREERHRSRSLHHEESGGRPSRLDQGRQHARDRHHLHDSAAVA